MIWKGRGLILDGHNRFEIAQSVNMPFDVVEREFADIEGAKLWMLSNQLGRRNLKPDQYKTLLGRLYNANKRQGERRDRTSGHNDQKCTTAHRIAERAGVSEKTIRRAAKVVGDVEEAAKAEDAPEEIRSLPDDLTSGKKTLRQAKEQLAHAKSSKSNGAGGEKCPPRRQKGVVRVVKTPEGFIQAIRKHFEPHDVAFIVKHLQQ